MANGYELAKAYVQIVPSADGIGSGIASVLNGEMPAVGEQAGGILGDKITSMLKVAAIGAGVAAIGVAAVEGAKAVATQITETAELADQIDKQSQKLGISATAYQEWDAVLQHSGTSMDAMSGTFKTLANAAQDASDDQVAAFEAIGLSMDEVASMSTEDLFGAVITGLQGMEEGTERTALATDLLGRGAMEMGALLNTSAEETQQMIDTVHELGGVMSDDAIKAGAAFQDSLQNMNTAIDGMKNQLFSTFLPAISTIMDGISLIFSGDSESGLALVKDGINNLVEIIVQAMPDFIAAVGEIAIAIIQAIIDNIPAIIEGFKQVFPKMIEAGKQLLPSFKDLGGYIIQGLIDGITGLAGAAIDAVGGICSGIWSNVTGFFGIHSPSTKMRWIGEMMGEGLSDGIDSATDLVMNSVDELNGMTMGGFNSSMSMNVGTSDGMGSLIAIVSALSEQVKNMRIVLDSGQLVGGIKYEMNDALGGIARREARV